MDRRVGISESAAASDDSRPACKAPGRIRQLHLDLIIMGGIVTATGLALPRRYMEEFVRASDGIPDIFPVLALSITHWCSCAGVLLGASCSRRAARFSAPLLLPSDP